MKRELILKILTALLAFLFFYAATSKLADFETSKMEMLNQVFPGQVALILVWLIPLVELMTVILLLLNSQQLKGLYASFVLLSAFSLYIAVTMSGAFKRIPCSCGGILDNMGYGAHLLFNLFFIMLTSIGIVLKRRLITQRNQLHRTEPHQL